MKRDTTTDDSLIEEVVTHLLGTGQINEGLVVSNLHEEVQRLRALVKAQAPTCPHCLTPMVPTHFKGYYDSFSYWDCACETIPNTTTTRKGAFA